MCDDVHIYFVAPYIYYYEEDQNNISIVLEYINPLNYVSTNVWYLLNYKSQLLY